MKLGHFPMHGKLPMWVFTVTHFRRWSNNLHSVSYLVPEMRWRFRISGNAEASNSFRSILQIILGRIYETSFRKFIECRNTQPTRFEHCQKRLYIMVTSSQVTMVPEYRILPLIRIIRPSRMCFVGVIITIQIYPPPPLPYERHIGRRLCQKPYVTKAKVPHFISIIYISVLAFL